MLAVKAVLGVNCKLSGSKLLQFSQTYGSTSKSFVVRLYSQDKTTAWRSARAARRPISETVSQPTAITIGKGAVTGGALFGLGALCYYGLGLSSEVGTIETSRIWPKHVRDRVRDTYMYFGSSLAITAASATAVFRSPLLMKFVSLNSLMAIGASLGALILSSVATQMLEYSPGFGAKQVAWMVHSGVMGAVIAPMCIVGGPILMRACLYTLGIVGGLSTIAVCAPSDKFLSMGGPLAMGLGFVFISNLASFFVPATTAVGTGLLSISLYGGLLLFSGLMLYDTQRIIRAAEMYPTYGVKPYDPINASISIYMDTMNILIRMVAIMSGGNSKR